MEDENAKRHCPERERGVQSIKWCVYAAAVNEPEDHGDLDDLQNRYQIWKIGKTDYGMLSEFIAKPFKVDKDQEPAEYDQTADAAN